MSAREKTMSKTRPRRLDPRGDERGSMAVYLVLAIVGLAIAGLLMPMVVTSSKLTRSDTSRTRSLDAAQAGINVMVGAIRASQSAGVGTSLLLPCNAKTGVVNTSSRAAYSVAVTYYTSNPTTTSATRPTAMRCVDGYGTYDPVSDTFTPKFARIISTGTEGVASGGSTAGRTVALTYKFKSTNSNIVGGRIRIYPAAGATTEFCMDAGSATPTAGTVLALQPCATPPQDQQIFAYRSDLTLQLVSSVSAIYSNGLCVDTAAPPTTGNAAVLRACSLLGTPPYTQQWSYNDNGQYQAAIATSTTTGALSSVCLGAPSQNAGVALNVTTCSGGAPGWIPSPAVGAGAAKAPQLVNYYEFGRCLDVTNQQVSSDHLIAYPCKQNPYPLAVTWNQKFTGPGIVGASATGTLVTTPSTTPYCLTSPGTETGLVTVTPCVVGRASQTWTFYSGDASLPYSTKNIIVDSSGRCLGLTTPRGSEFWSAIDVETCDGTTEQKWNAAADLSSSTLGDITELANP